MSAARRFPPRLAVAIAALAAVAWIAGSAFASDRDGAERAASLAAAARSLAHPFRMAAADSDTTIDEFLGEMSDSTAAYFGLSASERDTAGLDSALSYQLENGIDQPRQRVLRPGFGPHLAFNRVDGPVYGGFVTIGAPNLLGQLRGDLRYAVGPNQWQGGGSYRKSLNRWNARWTARLAAGRETYLEDRDHSNWQLASARALLAGKDHGQYLRRDGFDAWLERETETSRFGVGYRDMLESPLATTTTWNLVNREPSFIANVPATRGRAREFGLEAAMRLPFTPVIVEATHFASGSSIGSDFSYQRTRVSASGNYGLGSLATLVPQALYGRLGRMPLPQEAFYLGGSHSLRSMSSNARGGTGMAVARIDLIGAFDVLKSVHLPHPDAVPVQAGVFAATGAAWGPDPFGGPPRGGVEWPTRENWVHEAGVSLIYQPGIPDPTHLIRLSYAFPIGPRRESTHWTISYTRAVDLVKALGGD